MNTLKTLVFVVSFIGLATVVSIVFFSCTAINVKIRQSVVDEAEYLGDLENSSDIYAYPAHNNFYPLFNCSFAPFKKMALVDIQGHDTYQSIELMIIQEQGEEKPLILLYRKEGKIDVYIAKGVKNIPFVLSYPVFDNIFENIDIDYEYRLSAESFYARVKMKEKEGQAVEFTIHDRLEDVELKSIVFPIGGEFKHPFFFPYYCGTKCFFISVDNSQYEIRINKKEYKMMTIPVKIESKSVYLGRFTGDIMGAQWNEDYNGVIYPIKVEQGRSSLKTGYKSFTNRFIINDNTGYSEIKHFSADFKNHTIYFIFSPAIPELSSLKDGVSLQGRFSSGVNDISGIMAGEYTINRQGDKISMQIIFTKGSQPNPGELWLKAYKWRAELKLNSDGTAHMVSAWENSKTESDIFR